jgi:hypothetical protein
MSKKLTIRAYTEQLLQHVHFVDVHGRKIGYDYPRIRDMIKAKFPNSNSSQAALRYERLRLMNRTRATLPMHPRVRSGSRVRPAAEYTRALLMRRNPQGHGLSFRRIRELVHESFPEVKPLSLVHVCRQLRAHGLTPPEQRAAR